MSVKRLHEAIALLSFLQSDKENVDGYVEKLLRRIKKAENLLIGATNGNFKVRWEENTFKRYTYVALNLLKALALAPNAGSPLILTSMLLQQNMMTVLQMILSFGMLPSMKPVVEEVLQSVFQKLNFSLTEARTFLKDHQVMGYTLQLLLLLIKYPTLYSLILYSKDILGGLLQHMPYENIKDLLRNPIPENIKSLLTNPIPATSPMTSRL